MGTGLDINQLKADIAKAINDSKAAANSTVDNVNQAQQIFIEGLAAAIETYVKSAKGTYITGTLQAQGPVTYPVNPISSTNIITLE